MAILKEKPGDPGQEEVFEEDAHYWTMDLCAPCRVEIMKGLDVPHASHEASLENSG